MYDILKMIIDGEISEDNAYEIYDKVMDKFHSDELANEPRIELGMDNYEWTAFCHGASLSAIAKWRKNGWQEQCNHCGSKIDYKEYGWMIRDNKLIGVKCCDG